MADAGEMKVAFASLIKLINLLGAELLVGKHRKDIDIFEACVRAKLYAHVEGVNSEETAAGVALAQSLVDPVLKNLRERVRSQRAADAPSFAQARPPARLLN